MRTLPVLLVCFCVIASVMGQEDIKKTYTTGRLMSEVIEVDGMVKDAAWDAVAWGGGDFVVRQPNEGEAPTEQTYFKILYDDQNLYIAVRCLDAEPDKVVRRMSRRDGFEGDWVEVNIDSYYDKQTAFSFTINAAGVRGDEFISENGNNWDSSWDPIWFAESQIVDDGWTTEMRIPLSQLRFGEKEEQVWGMQFTRRYFRKNERSTWQEIPQNSPGWVHLFGELHGIKGIKPGRQIELLPYTVGKNLRLPADPNNPFVTGNDYKLTAGLDGKIGLTSDLTLDFTINPDFGQVEADPSEVNLTAFESFFSERRPFFVAGRNILDYRVTSAAWGGSYSRDNLFYSRRIGRSPRFYPDTDDNAFVDQPVNASILGALKVTGKTKSGWSIGILESMTSEEKAEIDLDGVRSKEVVEPLTNYFASRLEKDMDDGNRIVGAIFTATNRKIDESALNFLHTAAYSGGLNFTQNFRDRKYYFDTNLIMSRVEGDEEALSETQQSSRRYFQRSDATHLTFDSTRTSLSGHGGTLKFGRSGNFRFQSGVTWRSPGLELNDLGFQRAADEINEWTWISYVISKPFSIFNRIQFNSNTKSTWDFNRKNLGNLVNYNSNLQFKNQWNMGYGITHEFEGFSKSALRGGPLLRTVTETSANFWVNTDQRKKVRLNFGGWNLWGGDDSARMKDYWAWISIRPSEAMSLSVNPSFFQREDELQYVSTSEFGADDRYVFAQIDQKTVSLTLRLNYSVTPELSIEYYGSPFISAGKYSDFKQVVNPAEREFDKRFVMYDDQQLVYNEANEEYDIDENRDGQVDYSIGDPDFNFRAFNSNLVVRWEYIAGSTLFLVWSQGRVDNGPDGNFRFRNDLDGLFSKTGNNVFLIKASRWFSL
ncbi:MAG: DUF5916 domain-containing protein [Calditrichia bacterium]